eukprot:CAMPEP_0170564636 /NCGR_PEP_ID=MMETSP0211-20121228/74042_1 /TAXON_ID=311385 /ORGANISM="Pseudokeronopsis sp., Strain OXSARD2" /LENGTH=80 /DNA_ID=CAMNT_0010884359 /DNA_START=133 /DNA_END=372 /DNA_ORIENTATION=-
MKYVLEEGKGLFIDEKDLVFYRHETRYDNGQLVDYNEKRKAIERFDMGGAFFHEFYKIAFRTMKKGEVAWLRFSKDYHSG